MISFCFQFLQTDIQFKNKDLRMHYRYKQYQNLSFSSHLSNSAVYRPTSPPTNKFFQPSSSFHQCESIARFKREGFFCSPQTHKKSYLRDTVDPNQTFSSHHQITLIQPLNKHTKRDILQEKLQKERSPFKAICFNQETDVQKLIKNKQKTGQRKVAQNKKNNFQIQQPLFNKIIKKIDDKQKLMDQIKKIVETQLPTRNKKSQKQLKSIQSVKNKDTNQSYLTLSYLETGQHKENYIKDKYLTESILNKSRQNKNPEEKYIKEKSSAYFTKTIKSYNFQDQMRSTSSTIYEKYLSPQNVTKSAFIDRQQPFMKKKSLISYNVETSQIKIETKSPKITSTSELLVNKEISKTVKLSDFIIAKKLGEGKFGTVIKVVHKQSGFIFALKKISKTTIKSHFMIQQLALQIKIQSFCNHINIVKIYAVFDDSEHLYLLLEYMEEGTLFNYLKKQQKLQQNEAATKVKEVAQAIKYLHDHGIAHRDIKPQNIVLTNGMSKLCDFGWATVCNQRRRTYCGTFDYAAPEILQGSQYDMSVDMWCLGVLAYQLLVGKAPFYHISRKQTMKKIMNVSSTNIDFPNNLTKNSKDFIKKLLIKQPEQRMNAQAVLKHPFLAQLKSQ